jgi:uncharacterized protein (TIGR03085 family)
VATLEQADPYASTLCAGWDVRRLLAHLVVREQEPLTSLQDARTKAAPGEEPGLSRLVGSTATPDGYRELVSRFAAGPPAWSPMSWAGEQVNLMEYVIHHEDIRRAGPDPAEPRTLPTGHQDAIWKQLGLVSRASFRKAPAGVALATPAGAVQVAKKGRSGVTLVGEPAELAFYISGRRDAARVEVTGPDASVAGFLTSL